MYFYVYKELSSPMLSTPMQHSPSASAPLADVALLLLELALPLLNSDARATGFAPEFWKKKTLTRILC